MQVHKQQKLPFAAIVEEDRGNVFTSVKISAPSWHSLQQGVQQYLKDFSPKGYSTRVVEEPRMGKDGVWRMKLSRYSSCD